MGYQNTCRRISSKLKIRSPLLREFLAEFIGTYILLVFGDGSVAQNVLFPGSLGTPLSVHLAYGMAVTFGVFVSGGVTGGHINPAVSVAMALIGRLKWTKVPLYALAQYIGSFMGAATVYGIYYDAINSFDGGMRNTTGPTATAGIFSTFPQDYVSTTTCFFDQVFGTALLVGCILAVTDKRNMGTPKPAIPFAVGALVVTIGMTFGANCGYAINPARDLAPRIFTLIAGWGIEPFRNYNYFWVPIVGPHVGAVVGAVLYLLLIELHWPDDDDDDVKLSYGVQKQEHDNLTFNLETNVGDSTSHVEKE